MRDKNTRRAELLRDAFYGEIEASFAHRSFVRAVRLKHLFRELRCNLTPIMRDVLVGDFVTAFVAGAYEMFRRLPERYPQLRSLDRARRAFVTARTPFTLLFAVDDTTFSTSPHQLVIERDEFSPVRRIP